MLFLVFDALFQPAEIVQCALDLVARAIEFGAAHQGCGAGQPAPGSLGDGQYHIQVAHQLIPQR
jgi:hypothetical protein